MWVRVTRHWDASNIILTQHWLTTPWVSGQQEPLHVPDRITNGTHTLRSVCHFLTKKIWKLWKIISYYGIHQSWVFKNTYLQNNTETWAHTNTCMWTFIASLSLFYFWDDNVSFHSSLSSFCTPPHTLLAVCQLHSLCFHQYCYMHRWICIYTFIAK